MPNSLENLFHSNNATLEIAGLMRDIGDAVGMNYSCDGSGARTSDARNALVNTFGYSSSTSYVDYEFTTVSNELSDNRPVIMRGSHTRYTTGWWIFRRTRYRDGHAWVCDGRRKTTHTTIHNPGTRFEYTTSRSWGKYLHMNWGWDEKGMGGGDNNGWFMYNNFSISNGSNFQYKKMMIIRLQP